MGEENKKIKISLSTLLLLIAIIIIVVMGVVIYKLNNDKKTEIQKTTELQTQINSLDGTVDNLLGKLNNISDIIDDEEPVETPKNKKDQDNNTPEKLSFSEVMQSIYPNNTGNISRSYYGAIDINIKYNGKESEIEVTIKENNFGEKTSKTKLLVEDNKLKEKVVDVSVDYSIYTEGIQTITILTENGNAYTVPWAYGRLENTAQLIKTGEKVIRLGDGGGFNLAGDKVFYNDTVYVDGE